MNGHDANLITFQKECHDCIGKDTNRNICIVVNFAMLYICLIVCCCFVRLFCFWFVCCLFYFKFYLLLMLKLSAQNTT